MSKIAILCDSHFGVKNGNDFFLDYQERFFRDIFFPYCLKNGIKTIIHLGDYFDNRRHIPVKVMNRSRKAFLDKLRDFGLHMHIIPGNHDVLFRSTNDICSLKEAMGYYTDCVTIHMKPGDVEIEGQSFCMMPWINADNLEECQKAITSSSAPIMCAHLELSGFQMMKGIMSQASHEEVTTKDLDKFDFVFTGHYHTKSSSGNIHYLGTQFELTWADSDDPKYFHVFNTETHKNTRVRSPETIFHKLYYDDSENPEEMLRAQKDKLTGTYIRIIVSKKEDTERFDRFVDEVALLDPEDLKVFDSYNSFKAAEDQEDEDVKDTLELIRSYIDDVETDLDKEKLKRLAIQLHIEASNLED